ncbi:MAG: hypothetical protein HOB82_03630 [Alphaproteobacteria bacterium]|jgi:hypothetical protein|nr:hypothetical protein [Alphaproteobacteria bacterium]MBT4710601.1 hypothetical protein [Alphaproteobacteria bacterium]MBT5860050.1 hypothetical protein [Alphaproteobacteria bacterium]
MAESEKLQAKLDALRVTFANGIAERLDRIRPDRKILAVDGLGEEAAEALVRVHRESHSLAGTAPVFGFDELGKSAREAEESAQACIAGTTAPGAPLADAIDRMIGDLETAAEAGDVA